MDAGMDSPIDCGKHAKKIVDTGVTFVGRYYRSSASSWPKLTASEARVLSAAGLQLVALWESASDHASYFTKAVGVRDATAAYAQALEVEQPANTPIYFAVDFDASPSEISGCVSDYFAGVAAGYHAISDGHPQFDIGVYGSGATCSSLLKHHLVRMSWLAVSGGWAGSHQFDDWNIKQGVSLKLGFDNDSDYAKDGYGGFQVG